MNKRKFSIDWTQAEKKAKEQQNTKGSFKDERIYYPQFKDDGTAQAIIRFLPSPDTDLPYVELWSHSYKGQGGWYIDNCPTTIKQECPFCKANSAMWDELSKKDQSSRKRKLNYYVNILVVKDPANPSNDGKVFLFKYGKKIQDKIMAKWMPPSDSIDTPIPIFDYYDGANFKLLIHKEKVGDAMMPNYDSAHFDVASSIGTDEVIEKIVDARYSLKDYRQFKTFDELKEKLNKVMGTSSNESSTPTKRSVSTAEPATKEPTLEADEPTDAMFAETDDSFFADLK